MSSYEKILANVRPADSSDESDVDSDEELREAFAAGLIKPGLNIVGERPERLEPKNNVAALRQKLGEVEKRLPWIERLDVVTGLAPLAPELAYLEDRHGKEREGQLKRSKSGLSLAQDEVHNDFKREMTFYRQAQAAVMEALPRLHSMQVPTRRPDDYFAQMAKSDDHMQRIRQKLLTKQQAQERIDKVKKLRELKKYGKKVQVEVQQKRQQEKKEMLDEVKKFKKGQSDNLEFLEGGGRGKKAANNNNNVQKRKAKDKKFGFGGKKRGMKKNTKNSTDDVSEYRYLTKPFPSLGLAVCLHV